MGSADDWWNSGSWTKEAASEQFMKDITSLEIAEKIESTEVETYDMTLPTPKGDSVRVSPFYVVRGLDENNKGRATAYYRIGKEKIGLVRLFSTL